MPGRIRLASGLAREHVALVLRRAAQVGEIDRTLGPVASARNRALAVVEHFGHAVREARARSAGDLEARNGRAVLSEVDHKRVASLQLDGECTRLRDDLSVATLARALGRHVRTDDLVPDVCGNRRKRRAQSDLRADDRLKESAELVVPANLAPAGERRHAAKVEFVACVVELAFPDAGPVDRAPASANPRFVRRHDFRRAIRVFKPEFAAERILLAASLAEDAVAPPAARKYGGEDVGLARAPPKQRSHVVLEGVAALFLVREAGLQHVLRADLRAVGIAGEDAKSADGPAGGLHVAGVCERLGHHAGAPRACAGLGNGNPVGGHVRRKKRYGRHRGERYCDQLLHVPVLLIVTSIANYITTIPLGILYPNW